jgi:hypothetical protein
VSQALAQTPYIHHREIDEPDIGGAVQRLIHPTLLLEHEIDSARRTSAQMVEELPISADESKSSRSSGQKPLKIFSDFSFSSDVALA